MSVHASDLKRTQNEIFTLAKQCVWQAQANNDVKAWEAAILALKAEEQAEGKGTTVPHLTLYESLQALFYNPPLRKTAAHILLNIADELKAEAHRQAIRAVVGYYFEVRESNAVEPAFSRTTILAFAAPAARTPKPCGGPPH